MTAFLLVVHVMIAIALIGTILLQRSEGGALGIGGGGGGGGMGGLFSSRGAANALTRTTAFLAIGFFLTSIALSILSGGRTTGGSVIGDDTSLEPITTLPLPEDMLEAPVEEGAGEDTPAPAIPAPSEEPSGPSIPQPQ